MSSLWTLLTGFSGENDSTKNRLRKITLLPAAFCLGLCLAACGDSARTQAGPSPPSTTSATSSGGSSTATPTLAPIIAPPGSDDRPLQPGSLGRPIASDGLPALQPPKGTNVSVDTLFADDIKDPIERSKRLETAVVEMRRDLDAAMPAIKRLVAIEKDIQLLSSQLETLLNSEGVPPVEEPVLEEPVSLTPAVVETTMTTATPPSSASEPEIAAVETGPPAPQLPPPTPPPVPVPVTPQMATPPPAEVPPAAPPPVFAKTAVPSGAPAVLGLRLGEHPGRTRLVFDMSGPSSFRTDLDNAEKLFIVEIEKAAWAGTVEKVSSSPLVQSYTAQPIDGGGTRIILVLKAAASVASEKLLAPDSNTDNTRLVIDLTH